MGRDTWNSRELRVAIVGSGPSGFFTAEALLNCEFSVSVDMFERLPVPYGLIRYGISPDHPRTKNIINRFNELGQHKDFSFRGNVTVGKDISFIELQRHYDVVVFSYD